MIIKIADIPPEGKDLAFELDAEVLNTRVALVRDVAEKESILPPAYVFRQAPQARLNLSLEGTTVVVSGEAEARYLTNCARCLAETEELLCCPVRIVLKPRTGRRPDEEQEDDLHFGYYDGNEVDCTSFVEEFLILALPFVVLCREDCRGICPECGQDLNQGNCSCAERHTGDDRLRVLQGLKLE